ncbi:MAG: DUF58 domain-containing protein [Propionivibrio sp.]
MSIAQSLRQWLFRFGRDEQSPIVLTQRRIFIVPTGSGLLFAVVLCVMLLGAINYDLSLGHALVFLLGGLGIVAMVHTFRNLVALRLSPGRVDPVFAGDLAHFPLSIENTRPYPRRALAFSFGTGQGTAFDVPGNDRVTAILSSRTAKRGRHEPGRITLVTRYPLGLFRAWSYPHPTFSCLVYPKPIDAPLPVSSIATPAGQHHGERGQEDFSGLRAYQSNDSPRHIAWKAVARDIEHRPLLIKQFAGGASEELWLDLELTPADASLETRLSILAGWILAAEAAHIRYGLRLPGRAIPPDQGDTHRAKSLEALALYG